MPGGISATVAARDASLRTHEALDVIRGDFENLVGEMQALRLQRDEYELKGMIFCLPYFGPLV